MFGFRRAVAFEIGAESPAPLDPPGEEEVMSGWSGDEPVISVLCATYQHVDFIDQALKGFLSQRTDFPFEIIVRDDASTDGTTDILQQYARRYPSIISLILERQNQWPGVKPLGVLLKASRGQYLALCEGDDYWLDPEKLQRQVAYLESHPQVSLVETDRLDIEDGQIKGIARGGTRTYFFRRFDVDVPEMVEILRVPHPDIALRLFLSTRGRLASLRVVTAVWRYHAGGGFGPRGRSEPRTVQMDDLESIFTTGAVLQDRGVEAAGTLAAREMVLRVCNSFGISPRSMFQKVVIPAMVQMIRQKFINRARQRRLGRPTGGERAAA